MDSRIIFDIFGNFEMSTKFGTLGPLLLAEVLFNIQQKQLIVQQDYLWKFADMKFDLFGNCARHFYLSEFCLLKRWGFFDLLGLRKLICFEVLKS